MTRCFTLEYWIDDGWYVGRLKEVPGVFSQGETLEELEDNIRDAYQLMMETDDVPVTEHVMTKDMVVEV
jgi:predicted RNase H-like HicB family nuclease